MYKQFGPAAFATITLRIQRGDYISNQELADMMKSTRGKRMPVGIADYLCLRLEGKAPKPRGPRPSSEKKARVIIAKALYERYLDWLQERKRKHGLRGWSYIRDADWWYGSPSERAAEMTAIRMKHLWPDVGANHIQNAISSSRNTPKPDD